MNARGKRLTEAIMLDIVLSSAEQSEQSQTSLKHGKRAGRRNKLAGESSRSDCWVG
jgi:hypothetical protein